MYFTRVDAEPTPRLFGAVHRLGNVARAAVLTLCIVGCTDTEVYEVTGDGVMSATSAWVEGDEWTLSERPRVSLGRWEQGAETFEGIRMARHIAATEIAVIDRTVAAVRVFDMTGSLVTEIGREGDGPGEFRFANYVEELRDTIYVADQQLRRISRFDRSGRFIDQMRLPEGLVGPVRIVGIYPSGSLLVQQPGVGGRAVVKPGALPPDTTTWYRYSPADGTMIRLASAIAREVYGHPWAGGFALGEVIFGARAHAALDQATLLVARAEGGFEIEQVDSLAGTVGRFGLAGEPTPPTSDDVRGYVDWRIANAPSNADTEAWRAVFDDAPVRDRFPSTAGILIDGSGFTWVQHFERLGAPEVWAIFDLDRRWLGNLQLPPDTNLLDVKHGQVIASHRDELGVETLRVYVLNRLGSADG